MQVPTRTEYKGVVYRSKSEAIFARCLDLSFSGRSWHNCMRFKYEPKSEDQPPHDWDFHVWGNWGGFFVNVFIEYKPSYPTLTYAKNLKQKIKPWFEKRSEDETNLDYSCIVYGSPYVFQKMQDESEEFDPDTGERIKEELPRDDPKHRRFNWAGDNGYWFYLLDGTRWCDGINQSVLHWFGITRDMAMEAMKYRFDLSHLERAK